MLWRQMSSSPPTTPQVAQNTRRCRSRFLSGDIVTTFPQLRKCSDPLVLGRLGRPPSLPQGRFCGVVRKGAWRLSPTHGRVGERHFEKRLRQLRHRARSGLVHGVVDPDGVSIGCHATYFLGGFLKVRVTGARRANNITNSMWSGGNPLG